MTGKLILETKVAYADVDHAEVMLLPRLFKLLQDAAIAHASEYGATTTSVARGETWVLNRIAVAIARYPRVGEPLQVETWSSGIKGFKGYRDFRVRDGAGETLVSASSLWLYVSQGRKAIVRVPREIAEGFPTHAAAWCPDLENQEFEPPAAAAPAVPLHLRYSDFDANAHVNNAAYLDLVQTALHRLAQRPHPRRLRLKYAKEIPAQTERIEVRVETRPSSARFSVEAGGVLFACGEAAE